MCSNATSLLPPQAERQRHGNIANVQGITSYIIILFHSFLHLRHSLFANEPCALCGHESRSDKDPQLFCRLKFSLLSAWRLMSQGGAEGTRAYRRGKIVRSEGAVINPGLVERQEVADRLAVSKGDLLCSRDEREGTEDEAKCEEREGREEERCCGFVTRLRRSPIPVLQSEEKHIRLNFTFCSERTSHCCR